MKKKEGKKNWGKHHGGLNPQNEEGSFHLKCRIAVFFHWHWLESKMYPKNSYVVISKETAIPPTTKNYSSLRFVCCSLLIVNPCNPLWFLVILGFSWPPWKVHETSWLIDFFRRLFCSKLFDYFFLLCVWESFMKDSLILTVVLSPPWLPHRVSKPLMTNIRYSPTHWG